MNYYKIFTSESFIGIACSGDFLTYMPQNNYLVITNEQVGQFIEYKNKLYRDTWMKPLPTEREYSFIQAHINPITREEYISLRASIEKNEEITIVIPEEEPYVPVIEPNVTLEFIRSSKINEMSYTCRITIEQGFDIELRGESHHFSLSTQDQLNLMNLNIMAQTQELIPYHADGEACEYYTATEINQIIKAANDYKIYHTTYFNALKEYINALETIEEIAAITYGTPIPEEYKSDVLRVLE